MNKKQNRKLRIYLKSNGRYYPFCWTELLTDGSFSFGLSSKRIHFDEYGTAVCRSGKFMNHIQTLRRGTIHIEKAKAPHVTFHPPKITQKSGIVHFVAQNGKVDEWNLDWFPVIKEQLLLCVEAKNFFEIAIPLRPKKHYRMVPVPKNVKSFRMNLEIYKRNTPINRLHDNFSFGNIHGYCPQYVVSLKFYEYDSQATCIYMASDYMVKV